MAAKNASVPVNVTVTASANELAKLRGQNTRLRTLLRELVEYWDAVMSDDATPEAVMMMEDAVRRAREEVQDA